MWRQTRDVLFTAIQYEWLQINDLGMTLENLTEWRKRSFGVTARDDQIVRDFGICVVRTPDGKVKVLGSDVGMTKGVRVCSSEGNGEKPTKSSKGFCKKNLTLLMCSKVQDVLRDCEVVGVPGSIAT